MTAGRGNGQTELDALEFAPGAIELERRPPSPLPRAVLYGIVGLFAATLAWAAIGRLDVIASAHGKLVPQGELQIVQPVEQGIVQEILVAEGARVEAGQVLMRLDARMAQADGASALSALQHQRLQLRRIDAELGVASLTASPEDPPAVYQQVQAQFSANRRAYEDAIAQEQAVLRKGHEDLAAALALREKLAQVVPVIQERKAIFDRLGEQGFAGKLMVLERKRELIEKEQDLASQSAVVESARAVVQQSERRLAQAASTYRQQLQRERASVLADVQRLEQEWNKQRLRATQFELRAPRAGIIKDLATHTRGAVVAPGTVMMTLVPSDQPLLAEVWIPNRDVGFIRTDQKVRVKLAGFPFTKYGLIEGTVSHVGADATDNNGGQRRADARGDATDGPAYRALVSLGSQKLEAQGRTYALAPGMQVTAEILLTSRTVLEDLFSPVQRAFDEAARER